MPNSYAISTRSKGDPSGSNNGAEKVIDYVNGNGKNSGNSVENYGGIEGLTMNYFYGVDPDPEHLVKGGVRIDFTYTSPSGVQGVKIMQIVTTNNPVGKGLYSYFGSDNGTIYYYDERQMKDQTSGIFLTLMMFQGEILKLFQIRYGMVRFHYIMDLILNFPLILDLR